MKMMLVSENLLSAVMSADRADGERQVEPKPQNRQKIQENALDRRIIDAFLKTGLVLQIPSLTVDARRAPKGR